MFMWIGYLIAFISNDRKTLHDMAAGTKVVLGRKGLKR